MIYSDFNFITFFLLNCVFLSFCAFIFVYVKFLSNISLSFFPIIYTNYNCAHTSCLSFILFPIFAEIIVDNCTPIFYSLLDNYAHILYSYTSF